MYSGMYSLALCPYKFRLAEDYALYLFMHGVRNFVPPTCTMFVVARQSTTYRGKHLSLDASGLVRFTNADPVLG